MHNITGISLSYIQLSNNGRVSNKTETILWHSYMNTIADSKCNQAECWRLPFIWSLLNSLINREVINPGHFYPIWAGDPALVQIDDLVQDSGIPIANTLEILHPCIKPSKHWGQAKMQFVEKSTYLSYTGNEMADDVLAVQGAGPSANMALTEFAGNMKSKSMMSIFFQWRAFICYKSRLIEITSGEASNSVSVEKIRYMCGSVSYVHSVCIDWMCSHTPLYSRSSDWTVLPLFAKCLQYIHATHAISQIMLWNTYQRPIDIENNVWTGAANSLCGHESAALVSIIRVAKQIIASKVLMVGALIPPALTSIIVELNRSKSKGIGSVNSPHYFKWMQLRGEVSSVSATLCSGADQRKYQSSTSLAFVRKIH